jgi:alpha-ribazole phosphatase
MRLWLVRHAAVAGVAGRCYGRTDLPADAEATRLAARTLAAALPAGVPVWISPLARCQSLADALQQDRPDLAPQTDARLAEMDFGSWEDREWSTIGAAAMDAWTRDFWNHAPGGGESTRDVFERVGHALDDARRHSGEVAWITHAGVIRTVSLLARGVHRIDDASDWPRDAVPFGSWTVIEL